MSDYKKIEYWIEISDYDFSTAEAMLETGRFLYVGFMCHQSVEKLLKAVFVAVKSATPPFTHSLIDLAKRAGIYDDFSRDTQDFLDYLQPLNIQARYPAHRISINKSLNREKCQEIISNTKLFSLWIQEKYLKK